MNPAPPVTTYICIAAASRPPLLVSDPFSKIRGPYRKLRSEQFGNNGQFLQPFLAEFQIVGVPHHVTKPLKLTHGSHVVFRDKCRSDSGQRQREPLNQPLMIVTMFVEVIFKAVANSLQNLF